MSYQHVNDEEDFEDNDSRPLASRSRIAAILHPDLAITRPSVYYDDGPFDAPSSDEGEGLIEKQDLVLSDDPNVFSDTEPGNGLLVGGTKVGRNLRRSRFFTYVDIEEAR